MTIDEKIKKLQQITEELDSNETTFEKSIELFKEASELSKELYKELSEAKGKVTILKQDLDKFKEEGMVD